MLTYINTILIVAFIIYPKIKEKTFVRFGPGGWQLKFGPLWITWLGGMLKRGEVKPPSSPLTIWWGSKVGVSLL